MTFPRGQPARDAQGCQLICPDKSQAIRVHVQEAGHNGGVFRPAAALGKSAAAQFLGRSGPASLHVFPATHRMLWLESWVTWLPLSASNAGSHNNIELSGTKNG